MSELAVGSLKGLAANSFVIDVATGSKLDLSAGAKLPAGSIIQVVSTTKTDTFSTTSTSYADVTGLTASITPSSTSSKVLVMLTVAWAKASAEIFTMSFQVTDGSNVDVFANASTPSVVNHEYNHINTVPIQRFSASFVHSPNTTSAQTYKVRALVAGGTGYVNRNGSNTFFGASSITLMEVAG
jgi:hypothetical protein